MKPPATPNAWPQPDELAEVFGDIDVYLFDQILKGRITSRMRVLDAGCGSGRNLKYLLRCGLEVFGIDESAELVREVRALAARLAPRLPAENFQVGDARSMPFADLDFDVVISNAVLHFARDEADFREMLDEMWRVLKPDGMLFARLATSIGIEGQIRHRRDRVYLLPDGTERFLVDEAMLMAAAGRLGATPLEPLKTVLVQGQRSMTTWCVQKAPE